MTLQQYQSEYPDAPIMTDAVRARIEQATQVNMVGSQQAATVTQLRTPDHDVALHDVFGLGSTKEALNARGDAIKLQRLGSHAFEDMVPDIDEAYVFDIEMLKQVCLGLQVNIPTYIWGHAGTGKTTLVQQVCARLNRPAYRIQHTLNMIEADVVGDWRARDGNTYFELGPLPLAMQHGWVYISDEYDRAPPGVTALYQAVLEGAPLVIKEAPPEFRVIRPHKNFRIIATGNTNGSGDETGLYAGTMTGDAANYSRFGITERAPYMDPKAEAALIELKCSVPAQWATDLVRWANMVRDAFDASKITCTVGPRELIYAARVGSYRNDIKLGIRSAMLNRMNDVDREVCTELVQRIWG
jgi:cobaltochelatase CobS